MLGPLGGPELIIILVIVLVLFGVGRISGLGKELGGSIREFRRAVKDEEKEQGESGEQQHRIVSGEPEAQPPAETAPAQRQPSEPSKSTGESKPPTVF